MKTAKLLLLTVALLSVAVAAVAKTQTANAVSGNSSYIGPTNAETLFTQTSPDAVIKDLYKVHDQDLKAETDRILSGKNRTFLDKYFDKNLADLIWQDLTSSTDEIGVLDFDPFYNAQDFDIKNLVVNAAKIAGRKATVAVSFTNFKRKESLTYSLIERNNVWKISDIKYTNGDTLLKYFKESPKNNSRN